MHAKAGRSPTYSSMLRDDARRSPRHGAHQRSGSAATEGLPRPPIGQRNAGEQKVACRTGEFVSKLSRRSVMQRLPCGVAIVAVRRPCDRLAGHLQCRGYELSCAGQERSRRPSRDTAAAEIAALRSGSDAAGSHPSASAGTAGPSCADAGTEPYGQNWGRGVDDARPARGRASSSERSSVIRLHRIHTVTAGRRVFPDRPTVAHLPRRRR